MTKEDKKPGRILDYNKKLPVLEVSLVFKVRVQDKVAQQ